MWEILALYSKIWLEFGIMWLIHEDWELVNGVIKKFYNNMIKEFEFPTSWLLTWFSDANCRTIAKRVILYTSNHFEKKIAPLSSWLAALPSTTMQGGWTSRSGGGDHQIQGGGYDHPDGTGFGWPTTPRRWAPGVVAPPWGYHPWERLGKILFEMTWQGSRKTRHVTQPYFFLNSKQCWSIYVRTGPIWGSHTGRIEILQGQNFNVDDIALLPYHPQPTKNRKRTTKPKMYFDF